MSYLRLASLTRRFGHGAGIFDLSLELGRGETLALLGPSGSGKTTTLRLLGGFEPPDQGRILVDGEDVTVVRPEHRRFGMVFQHYALFPHLDVGENVAFGLASRGVRGAEAARRTAQALELVDLAGYERRRVGALSGGQQQRVALARALAPEPRVLLLDEPLSNLDPALRERTRGELAALIRRVGITTIIVTHEQEDAFDLGDRVAVLRDGRLQQVGTPEALYVEPANPFVAGFIGRASWLPGEVVETGKDGTAAVIRAGGAEWVLAGARGAEKGERGLLMFRPEALRPLRDGEAPRPGLTGLVAARRFAGAVAFYQVRTSDGRMLEIAASADAAAIGALLALVTAADPPDLGGVMRWFPGETGSPA